MTQKKEYLLSISLLMSGRKETEKCLSSLKPFIDQIPSEIIVVDTGCDEKTRKIIEKYTDNILPFTWCKDFSKARNVGLKAAKGEWFLYLDDDEWFEDPSEIIDFFLSGEYKNYNSACYAQRNYKDYQESGYTDATVSRMIRLEKETCFKSSIHEYLSPLKSPVKLFQTHVKHFGYLFTSNKEKYEHSKRNVELLLEMMKKEPMEFRWDTHILQEYWGIGEMSKLIEVSSRAIQKYQKRNEHDIGSRRSLGTFYGYLAEGYARIFDYDSEKKVIEAGLNDKNLTRLAKAFLYRSATFMNYSLERYESCVTSYEKYMSFYEKMGSDQKAIYDQGGILIGDTFQKERLEDTILHGLMAAARIGRDDLVKRDFYMLGWNEDHMLLHPDFQSVILKRMLEKPFEDRDIFMAQTMAERENNISGVAEVLQKLEEESKSKDNGDVDFSRLIHIFSHVRSDHWYITYLKILKAHAANDSAVIPALYDNLFSHVFDIFNLDQKLWQIADDNQISLEPFFLRIDFDTWRDGVTQWIFHTDPADLKEKVNFVVSWKKTADIRYDFFFMKAKEGILLHQDLNVLSFENLEQKIQDYIFMVESFYDKFYRRETFQFYPEMLPHECRFAVGFIGAIDARRADRQNAVLESLKPLVDVYPPLNKVIKIYSRKYGEYLKQNEAPAVNQEMIDLADTLKNRANELVRFGNTAEALEILKQLKVHFPTDTQITAMLKQLS